MRSSGAGRVGSAAHAAAHKEEVAGAAQNATWSLPVAAQSPADTSAAAGPTCTAFKKARPASDAAVQPTACVKRRPATRSLVQRAAMLAQDLKLRNGHAPEVENNQTCLRSAFLDASPKGTGELCPAAYRFELPADRCSWHHMFAA
jgi:hypothetical protein